MCLAHWGLVMHASVNIESLLVQVMACCLLGTNKVSKPMVNYHWECPSLIIVIVFMNNSPLQLCWCVGSSESHLAKLVWGTRCQGFTLLCAFTTELLESYCKSSRPKTGPTEGLDLGNVTNRPQCPQLQTMRQTMDGHQVVLTATIQLCLHQCRQPRLTNAPSASKPRSLLLHSMMCLSNSAKTFCSYWLW